MRKNGISAEIIDVRRVKPFSGEAVIESARKTRKIVTVEDNVIIGGFGSAVEEYAEQFGFSVTIKKIGWSDEFIPHGTQSQLEESYGMDAKGIAIRIARTVPEKLTSVKEQKENQEKAQPEITEKKAEHKSAKKSPEQKSARISRFRNRILHRR